MGTYLHVPFYQLHPLAQRLTKPHTRSIMPHTPQLATTIPTNCTDAFNLLQPALQPHQVTQIDDKSAYFNLPPCCLRRSDDLLPFACEVLGIARAESEAREVLERERCGDGEADSGAGAEEEEEG